MNKLKEYLANGYPIDSRISGILVGTRIDEYYDADIDEYHIEVDNNYDGSGTVTITNSKNSWTLVFRESSVYPDYIEGTDETLSLSLLVHLISTMVTWRNSVIHILIFVI